MHTYIHVMYVYNCNLYVCKHVCTHVYVCVCGYVYVCMYVCVYVRWRPTCLPVGGFQGNACICPFVPKPPSHSVFGRLSQVMRTPHFVAKACCLLSLTVVDNAKAARTGTGTSRLDLMGCKSTSSYRLSLFLRWRRTSKSFTCTGEHFKLQGILRLQVLRVFEDWVANLQ